MGISTKDCQNIKVTWSGYNHLTKQHIEQDQEGRAWCWIIEEVEIRYSRRQSQSYQRNIYQA